MELRSLRYFLAVAREGSITRAAESLHMTQPALSRQLKGLEDELGCELYTRGSRNVSLTDQGRMLRQRAEEIVAMADAAIDAFASTEKEISGHVRIGTGETTPFRVLSCAAQRMHEEHPAIQIHVYDGNDDDLAGHLHDGLLDFCLLVPPMDLSRFNHKTIPLPDIWGLLVRTDNPLAAREFITADDLIGEPLIFSRQPIEKPFSQNAFLDWFGDSYEKLNIVGTYNLAYGTTMLASQGLGSVVLLEGTAMVRDPNLKFVPFEPRLEVYSEIAWKRHRMLSPAAAAFLETLEQIIEEGAVQDMGASIAPSAPSMS